MFDKNLIKLILPNISNEDALIINSKLNHFKSINNISDDDMDKALAFVRKNLGIPKYYNEVSAKNMNLLPLHIHTPDDFVTVVSAMITRFFMSK